MLDSERREAEKARNPWVLPRVLEFCASVGVSVNSLQDMDQLTEIEQRHLREVIADDLDLAVDWSNPPFHTAAEDDERRLEGVAYERQLESWRDQELTRELEARIRAAYENERERHRKLVDVMGVQDQLTALLIYERIVTYEKVLQAFGDTNPATPVSKNQGG